MEDPAENLSQRLWDVLEGDLDNIPPSEREKFIGIKRSVKKIKDEDHTRRFFITLDLSDPEDAYRLEQIFENPGFVQAHDEHVNWVGDRMIYYVAMEVKSDLYERLRRSRINEGDNPVPPGHVVKETPESMVIEGFRLMWEKWVARPIRLLFF